MIPKLICLAHQIEQRVRQFSQNDTARNTVVYLSFSVFAGMINFFSLPILTHYLSVKDVGIIGIFSVGVSLLAPVMGFSMNAIIARSFHTRNDIEELVGSSFYFSFLLFVCISVVLIVIVPTEWITAWVVNRTVLVAVCISSFFTINVAVLLTVFQQSRKPIYWGMVTLLFFLLDLSINFTYVLFVDASYVGKLLSSTVSGAVTLVLAVTLARRVMSFRMTLNMLHFRYFVKMGSGLIVFAFGIWGLQFLDKAILQNLRGLEAVGYLTMAYTLARPMDVISVSLSRAWSPHAFESLSRNDFQRLFQQSILLFVGIIVIGIGIATVGHHIFQYIIAEKFSLSLSVMPILVAVFVVESLQKLLSPFFLHFEKTSLLGAIVLLAVILNIASNYTLIPIWGIYGAAMSSLFAFCIVSLCSFIFVWTSIIGPKN